LGTKRGKAVRREKASSRKKKREKEGEKGKRICCRASKSSTVCPHLKERGEKGVLPLRMNARKKTIRQILKEIPR